MKTIESTVMDAEMIPSPNGAKDSSDLDLLEDSEMKDLDNGEKILTTDSIHEALDKELEMLMEMETTTDEKEETSNEKEETSNEKEEASNEKEETSNEKEDTSNEKEETSSNKKTEASSNQKAETSSNENDLVEMQELEPSSENEVSDGVNNGIKPTLSEEASQHEPNQIDLSEVSAVSFKMKESTIPEVSKEIEKEPSKISSSSQCDMETEESPEQKEIPKAQDNDTKSTTLDTTIETVLNEPKKKDTPTTLVEEQASGSKKTPVGSKAEFYGEALKHINKIARTVRNLDDDTNQVTGQKRRTLANKPSEEPASKKARGNEGQLSETDRAELHKKIKKKLRRLTREEVENVVSLKIVDLISSQSEIGELRRQCADAVDTAEKWKRKAQTIQKMCQEINLVMKKFILDQQKGIEKPIPLKIIRSVGVQINMEKLLAASKVTQKPTNPVAVPVVGSIPRQANVQISKQTSQTPVNQAKNGVTVSITPSSPRVMQAPITYSTPPQQVVRQLPSSINIMASPIGQQSRVIDVVDLDDDDDEVTPIPHQPNQQNLVPISGNLRLVPRGQLQNGSGVSYTVVSNSASSTTQSFGQNVGGVVISRQQAPSNGGLIITRTPVNGTRPTSQFTSTPRTVVLSRPAMISNTHRGTFLGQTQIVSMRTPHPAPPLPEITGPQPYNHLWKSIPPRITLKCTRVGGGIVLSWNLETNFVEHEPIANYQIYSYQETRDPPSQNFWRKIGDVKALPLPMACTLTQFQKNNTYYFAIRAQDVHTRLGQFSEIASVTLT